MWWQQDKPEDYFSWHLRETRTMRFRPKLQAALVDLLCASLDIHSIGGAVYGDRGPVFHEVLDIDVARVHIRDIFRVPYDSLRWGVPGVRSRAIMW